jgi:hypothetical protein
VIPAMLIKVKRERKRKGKKKKNKEKMAGPLFFFLENFFRLKVKFGSTGLG